MSVLKKLYLAFMQYALTRSTFPAVILYITDDKMIYKLKLLYYRVWTVMCFRNYSSYCVADARDY